MKFFYIILILPLTLFSLTIEEANKFILSTSPLIQEQIKYYQSVKKDVDIAKAGYKPTVDLVAGVGVENTKNRGTNFKNVHLNKSEVGIILNQNLFKGFGTKYNIRRQNARVDSAAFGIIEQANKTSLRMTEVYIQLYKQKVLHDLAKTNVLSHIEINNQIKDRMDSGVGTSSEVKESASRLALAQSNVAVSENNYNDAISNFVRLYGTYVSPDILEEPKEINNLPISRKVAIEKSKIFNPSLKVQKANIEVEKNNLHLAKKEFYPKVDFEARKDWNYNTGGVRGKDESSSIMLKLNYNLYNGNADEASSEQSQKDILKEKEVFINLVRRVDESINLAWGSYKALKKQIKYLKIHRDLSQKTLDLYSEEFNLGRRTLLDILDTREEVYSAQRELATAQYDAIYAQYRILEAVGILSSHFDSKFLKIIDLNNENYISLYNATLDDDVKNMPMIDKVGVELSVLSENLQKNLEKTENNEANTNKEDNLPAKEVVTVHFKVWSYDLYEDSKTKLLDFVNLAKESPDKNIEVSGYTDSLGKEEVNKKRSIQRAKIVKKFLVKQGIGKQRIKAEGFGEENPIADDSTKEGRETNRRVEIKFVN